MKDVEIWYSITYPGRNKTTLEVPPPPPPPKQKEKKKEEADSGKDCG